MATGSFPWVAPLQLLDAFEEASVVIEMQSGDNQSVSICSQMQPNVQTIGQVQGGLVLWGGGWQLKESSVAGMATLPSVMQSHERNSH
jgi:hypothetical protein